MLASMAIAGRLWGQDASSRYSEAATEARGARLASMFAAYSLDAEHSGRLDEITTKNAHIGGPLAHPLKSKKLSEVPGRLLHLINPFAPTAHKESVDPVSGLSNRPWTTFSNWRPIGSAASGPLLHESQMGLFWVTW
jgi:hypothetical protein